MDAKELFFTRKTGFEQADAQAVQAYAEGYKEFLDEGKTERDAVAYMTDRAVKFGFRPFVRGMAVQPGDRLYQINRGKGIILAVIGEEALDQGVNLTAAHMDAPRVDIRTVPLYEQDGMAFFKTHYYGGIKKYQWMRLPGRRSEEGARPHR